MWRGPAIRAGRCPEFPTELEVMSKCWYFTQKVVFSRCLGDVVSTKGEKRVPSSDVMQEGFRARSLAGRGWPRSAEALPFFTSFHCQRCLCPATLRCLVSAALCVPNIRFLCFRLADVPAFVSCRMRVWQPRVANLHPYTSIGDATATYLLSSLIGWDGPESLPPTALA